MQSRTYFDTYARTCTHMHSRSREHKWRFATADSSLCQSFPSLLSAAHALHVTDHKEEGRKAASNDERQPEAWAKCHTEGVREKSALNACKRKTYGLQF